MQIGDVRNRADRLYSSLYLSSHHMLTVSGASFSSDTLVEWHTDHETGDGDSQYAISAE